MTYDELTQKINELMAEREKYVVKARDAGGRLYEIIYDHPLTDKERYQCISEIKNHYDEKPVYEV